MIYIFNAVRRQADPNPGAESHHAAGDLHLPAHVHSGGYPQRILRVAAGTAHDYHLVYRQPDLRPGGLGNYAGASIPQWEYSETYNGIVHSIMAVLVASSAAYLISENVNSTCSAKSKVDQLPHLVCARDHQYRSGVGHRQRGVLYAGVLQRADWDIIKPLILSQFLIKVVYALLGVRARSTPPAVCITATSIPTNQRREYAYPKQR